MTSVPDIVPLDEATIKIRQLNDNFRRTHGLGGEIYCTQGIAALGESFKDHAYAAALQFDDFNEHNDPHAEHDFGAFSLQGHKLFWKIDYYDRKRMCGSEDPSDPDQTLRVMTIMLAQEY